MATSNYICDKVQRAVAAYLKSETITGLPSTSVYKGLEAPTRDNPSDTRPPRTIPCVVAICKSATIYDRDALTWTANVEVQVITNCDDTDEDDHHALAAAVFNLLTTDEIESDLSGALADFTAELVNFTSQSWDMDDHSYVSTIGFDVICCGSDIS